jgi:MFS family permease
MGAIADFWNQTMIKKRKIFYGWWIVLAGAYLRFYESGSFYYGFTTFFNPIRNAFGWTAAITSVAFSLQRLETGLLGPISGFLTDRLGPRRMALIGWAIAGLGFLLMSRINALWAFYGAFVIIAMGMSLGAWVPVNTAIARWFTRKRSRAMTLSALGPGISGVVVPLIALSIGQFGWRTSLVILGMAAWAICVPVSLAIRNKPEQYDYLPDGEAPAEPSELKNRQTSDEITRRGSAFPAVSYTAREAVKTRAFWLLCLVSFFQQIGTSAVYVHIVPYLESVQFPTTLAAMAVTGMTVASILGRLGFGFLGDFTNKRYLIAMALSLQTIGLFTFSFVAADRIWLLILFLLTYSPGYGAPIVLRPAIQADYFGVMSFGTIMGLMSGVSMLGGLSSPVIAGWIFDITGSYSLAWRIFTLVSLPAIPFMLLAKPPQPKPEPSQTSQGLG